MRAVCGLLDMEVPKKVGTIIHVPPKEKEKLINERNNVSSKSFVEYGDLCLCIMY